MKTKLTVRLLMGFMLVACGDTGVVPPTLDTSGVDTAAPSNDIGSMDGGAAETATPDSVEETSSS